MPDVGDQTNALVSFIETYGVALLAASLIAFVAFRAVRPLVHRALVGLLERRVKESEEGQLGLDEMRKRVETVESLVSKLLRLLVVVLLVLVVMTIFDLLPVIAGLSLVLAALTVAGQDVIRDYIMGTLILLEAQYFKGDWIQVSGVEGTVEEVGLRRTVLRDATGTVHSVSNGDIRVASNLTRVYARMIVDVTVGFGVDLDRVTEIVNEVGVAMAADPEWGPRLLEPPAVIRVGAFTDVGVPLRIGGRVRAPDRFSAPGELRKRLLAAFQANQIEIPGVQRFRPLTPGGGASGGGAPGRPPVERPPADG
jgi:small conductance mechanosensitive channel